MSPLSGSSAQRRRLLSQIERLAEIAIFGTLSEPIAPAAAPAAIV